MDVFLALVIRLLVFIIAVVSLRPRWMTMSMPVIPDGVGLSVPYTVDELMTIVDVHNQGRGNVTPSAANMEYMYWDEQLAAAADGWAVKCTLEHGKPENSTISRFGQNIWAGFGISKWALPETISPFRAWNNEDRFYDYVTNSCKQERMCGHYTQIVWASTQTIGCGRAYCRRNEDRPFDRWIVVCNYSPGGNIQGRQPYIAGPSCTRCVSGNGQCYKNKCRPCFEHTEQCECNLQCQNCGTLDRETCTCLCPKGWHGNECGKPCVDTHTYCGKSPGWPARYYCPFASYIPRYCPLMCGVCEASDPNFVCEENSTDGDWQTTDAMTTEVMEDDVTTDMTTSYDDVTLEMTTSDHDISTTPFPMTTPDIDIVTEENESTTKVFDGVPATKIEEDSQNISTTLPTERPHWLETIGEIIDSNGNRVNYAAKSIDSEYSDELRSLVRNASYDALEKDVEISAHNGIVINGNVNATALPEESEMEFILTTQLQATTSLASRSSNKTDSEVNKSTGLDSYVAQTTEDYQNLKENTELVAKTPDPTKSLLPTTASHPPVSMATTSDQNLTEKPSPSETYHETTLPISTVFSVVNSTSNPTNTSSTVSTTSSEFLAEATVPTPTIQTDASTTSSNHEEAIGISTEATPAKYISTLNSTDNLFHTIKEDDESTDDVSEETTNASMLGGIKEIPKHQQFLVSEHLCGKTFTAAAVYGEMLFLFQGQHLWRVNISSGETLSEKETVQSYFNLDGQKVTAAFYRSDVDEWTLFTYIDVFIIRSPSQAQPIPFFLQMRTMELGIPFGVVVDAAFHDDRRKKSYLFTNRWVWRYDDQRGELDVGYPKRGHHEFPGLSRHRPSAAVTLNGTHYILYGKKYMMIDKETHRVDERKGENFLEEYFGCSSEH